MNFSFGADVDAISKSSGNANNIVNINNQVWATQKHDDKTFQVVFIAFLNTFLFMECHNCLDSENGSVFLYNKYKQYNEITKGIYKIFTLV